MPKTKYGKILIQDSYAKATKEFNSATIFNYDNRDKGGVTYEYHCINKAEWSIKDNRVHDTWELLCFIGGNPENIMDLGAEVIICLGNEKEEHIITRATVVSIPPGLKHGPIILKKYSKPFVLLRIQTTKEYEAKKTKKADDAAKMMLKTLKEGSSTTKDGKKYWMNIVQGPFFIEAEPGDVGTSIWAHHNEYKNGTTLGYHCIRSTYYVADTHSHDFHELLCFIGGNPEDVKDLGAEVSICLGDEKEEHVFNNATIISMKPGTIHCPLIVRNVTKPVVFLEISMTGEFGYSNTSPAIPLSIV